MGLIKIAEAGYEFGLTVALESCPRRNIENAVSTIAVIGGITPAKDLEIIDVLWINVRADIAGDTGIGNRNAVNLPSDSVSTPDVKLVIRKIGPRNVVRNHADAVCPIGSRRTRNFFPVYDRNRS